MALSRDDMDSIQRRIDRAFDKVMSRVRLATTRAGVLSVDDSTGIQNVKVSLLADEARDKVERMQRYGFTSNPPAGTEGVVVAIGANRDHLILIAEDDRGVRVTNLGPEESAQYSGLGGNSVICRNDGSIEVVPGVGNVLLGSAAPVEFVALATKTQVEIAKIATLLTSWPVLAMDGGLALQTAAIALWPSGGASVPAPAATKVKGF